MMKILILGKNGQLGSSLCASAKINHISYVATSRQELDITNQKHVTEFFLNNHDFNFIINAVAYTNVDGAELHSLNAYNTNCLAVQYLAQAAKEYDIPVIHISTDYIFDGKKLAGYGETDVANPLNVYGQTKLDGENALKMLWEKYIILRISWVFSEYGKNFVKTIVQQYSEKESFSIVCDQFGSPTSARSVAKVILHICKILHTELNNMHYFGIYHYTDFPATNWYQLAHYIAQLREEKTGIHKLIYPIASEDYHATAKRPKNSVLNTNKIKNKFGIKPNLWTDEVSRILDLI